MSASYAGASGAIWEPIVREVIPEITAIATRKRYAFLAALLGGQGGLSGPMRSTKIAWQDAALRANTATTAGATTSVGDTDVVVASGQGARFRAGSIVLTPNEELLHVTGVSTDTLTIVRGYSGTTAAAIASGAVLFIVGTAALEGAAFAVTATPSITERSNHSQIISEGFSITKTMKALATIDPTKNPYELHAMTAMGQLVDSMAGTLWYGGQPASTPQGSASVRRTADGAAEMMRTGSAAGTGGLYSDISGADFNDSATATYNIIDFIRDVYEAGGAVTDLFVSPLVASQLVANRTGARTTFDTGIMGGNTEALVTPFGPPIRVSADVALRSDHIAAIDMSKAGLMFLPTREPQIEQAESAGETEQYIAVTEMSFVLQDAHVGGHAFGYGAVA